MKGGLARPEQRAKGDKAQVAVKLLLAGGAGDDAQIVAVFQAVLPHQGRQAPEDLAVAELFFHREEADFAGAAAWRQVGIQIGQLLVQGKGAARAGGDHANDSVAAQADQVGVFIVEFIHQPGSGRGLMLGDLLHKSPVIELMNLFELPIFRCDFELQGLCAHKLL